MTQGIRVGFRNRRVLPAEKPMQPDADHELLRRYADHGCDEAFAELVRRHLNLVWAAARRVTHNSELARDVAQLVFTDLARKARTLPPETVIAGWLHRAAYLAAAKQIRGEVRRSQRERIAMTTSNSASPDESRAAGELQPVLDEALAELPETDRDAVVLRFLVGRSYAEVGATLGTSEDTAQKRVSRALEKLRESFRRRGLDVGGGLVVAALDFAGTQAAPAGLASTVATGALSAAGTATLVLLMKSKLTLGIVGGAALAVALAYQQNSLNRLTDENSALRSQLAAALATSPPTATAQTADSETLTQSRDPQSELLRLRGEVTQLRQAAREDRNRSTAARDTGATPQLDPEELAKAMLAAEAVATRTVNAQKHLALAAKVYSIQHQDRLPTTFEELKPFLGEALNILGEALSPDGTVAGVSFDPLEFQPHERDIYGFEPRLILLRERNARQLPDGTWERIYSLADGSVHRKKRSNGDFSDFEREGTGTLGNAPKPR
jgi:RNA polymerase sigma factor (sigma-70 family)